MLSNLSFSAWRLGEPSAPEIMPLPTWSKTRNLENIEDFVNFRKNEMSDELVVAYQSLYPDKIFTSDLEVFKRRLGDELDEGAERLQELEKELDEQRRLLSSRNVTC